MSSGRPAPAHRALFAAAVREQPLDLGLACTLVATEEDPGLAVTDTLSALDAFAALARPAVTDPGDWAASAAGLQRALGDEAGFRGQPADYTDLRASLLPDVLRRRHGLPLLLSVVWLEVARRVGVPAYPVAMPGHVVVGIGTPGDPGALLVDPFAGGRLLTVHDAADRVRESGAAFTREHLSPTPPAELLLRLLTNVRVLATRAEQARTRLWAVELSLLLPHHPASLRREHGELLARLGAYRDGAVELETYADAVEDAEPAAAEAARCAARMARARLN